MRFCMTSAAVLFVLLFNVVRRCVLVLDSATATAAAVASAVVGTHIEQE